MSINTKSKTRRILRHWRKGLVILGALVLSPSLPLFMFYLGFWFARWTYGLKITRAKKELPTVEEFKKTLKEVREKQKENA